MCLEVAKEIENGSNMVSAVPSSIQRARELAECFKTNGRTDLSDKLLKEVAVFCSPVELPPLLTRAQNFASALARWVAAGRPVRTQAEIDERLKICEECPQFVDNHCGLCGCRCVEENSIFNKLALATERCPIARWM